MRTALASLVALVALATAVAIPADDAAASHGRQCGVIAKGNVDYLVLAKKMGCSQGRKGAKRYLKTGKPLRGFKCEKNVGAYKFVCKNKTKNGLESYRAQRL